MVTHQFRLATVGHVNGNSSVSNYAGRKKIYKKIKKILENELKKWTKKTRQEKISHRV